MTKLIPLTQGKFALIDEEDYELISKYKWNFANGYACRFIKINNKNTTLYMHRFLLNTNRNNKINFKNNDKLDCRRANLLIINKIVNFPDNIVGSCWIPLTKNKFALIDEEDYELISKYKWCVSGNGYAMTHLKLGKRKYKKILMHRLILNLNTEDICDVDHKDHNKLNNTQDNLRLATTSQNMGNQNKQTRITSSIYKGVYFRKSRNKWIAEIHKDNKKFYIGSFNSELDAGKAYDKKAIELFGEFALLNIK